MKQSKIDSVLEALTNIFIGMGVAMIGQLVWFPAIGVSMTTSEHFATVLFFTGISFFRSYCVRRMFNGRSIYKTIKSKVI